MAAQRERGDLSRTEVVATALRLVDSGGLDACTVRALATELGVTPMAIYWHVRGKEGLFDAVINAVLDEIPTDDLPPDPFEALAVGARRYRAAFVRHPHAAPLLASRPMPEGDAARTIMATALGLLAAAGLDESERACAYLLLSEFVMGSVLTEHATDAGDAIRAAAGDLELPDAATRFEFGLACVLDGIRARVSGRRDPAR